MLRPGERVVATCRDPASAHELASLLHASAAAGSPHGVALPLDVACEDSIAALPALLQLRGVGALDALVHNAGVAASTHPIGIS